MHGDTLKEELYSLINIGMSKTDKLALQLLKDLEMLTDRSGSFSLAKPAAQAKMRSLVADFIAEMRKEK